MANIFLEANEVFELASSDDTVTGVAGGEDALLLQDGVINTSVGGNIDRIDLAGSSADTTFSYNSTTGQLEVLINGTVAVFFRAGLNDPVDVRFSDGNATLTQTGGAAWTLENPADDTDTVTIEDGSDQTGDSVTLGPDTSATGDGGGGAGQTFTLTADDAGELTILTTGADTVNAESGSLDGSTIIDQGGTDTLNATYKAADLAFTPTITDVENINVDLQVFNSGEFVATNVTGATITGSSTKLGFDGEFTSSGTGDNNVVAGTNITDLIVEDLEEGSVDAGAAETVAVTLTADTTSEQINLTANGDLDATVTYSATSAEELLNITAAAASVVTLNTASTVDPTVLEIAGTGDLDIDAGADEVTGSTITGVGTLKITENGANALDAENFTVDAIEYADNADILTISNATGQVVNVTVEDAYVTVDGESTTGETATVNVSADQDGGTGITLTDMDSFTVNLTADVAEIAVLAIEGETTVNVLGDVILTDVNKATATDELIIAGTGDVEVTDVDDVASVNSASLTGALDLKLSTDADIEVIAGSGDDDITVATTDGLADITTGDGANTIDATAITIGSLVVTGGAGVDTVMLDIAAADAATIAMDGGAGGGVIDMAGNTDITDVGTWAVTNFTSWTYTDAAGANAGVTLDVLGSQTAGVTSLSITTSDTESDDDLVLTVDANEATTDLSAIVVGSDIVLEINGQATADDISGTNANETIVTNGGADTVDISKGGADEVIITSGQSASTAMVTIDGFDITDATSTADTLTLDTQDIAADTVASGAVDVKDAITDGDGTEDVTLSIDGSGIATLSGDDAADIDTLAEWVAAFEVDGVLTTRTGDDNSANGAETLISAAFEFNGNTYVVSQLDGDTIADTSDIVTDIVELTGVEGITALDTSAALNTVLLG